MFGFLINALYFKHIVTFWKIYIWKAYCYIYICTLTSANSSDLHTQILVGDLLFKVNAVLYYLTVEWKTTKVVNLFIGLSNVYNSSVQMHSTKTKL